MVELQGGVIPPGHGGRARLGSLAQPLLCCAPAVDHVVPEPESSLAEALERWREWADGKACCDYALHVDIPRWSDHVKQELHAMVQEKGLCLVAPRLALASPVPWPGRARDGCAVGCLQRFAQLPAGTVPHRAAGGEGGQSRQPNLPSSPLSPLCLAPGVNSFMVYMAYKDLYQMSNTEVRPPAPPWLC